MRGLARSQFYWKPCAFALALFCAALAPGEALAQSSKPTCKTKEVYQRMEVLRKRIELYDKREGDAQVDVASAEAEVFTAQQELTKARNDPARADAVNKAKQRTLSDYRKELERQYTKDELAKRPLDDKMVEEYRQSEIRRAGEPPREVTDKVTAARDKLRDAQGRLRRASRELRDSKNELDALQKLPECDKSQTMSPRSGCSSGCLAGLPSGLTVEATAFAGGVSATSFGSNFDTSAFGGRFAAAFQAARGIRFQIDAQGEATDTYCTACGSRSYVAGAGHVDWSPSSNVEIGAFGGAQDARPTFNAPTSTNGFGGIEYRIFVSHAVFGGNVGYFDVASGPGTLTKAWFTEARAKFELAPALGKWKFGGPTFELGAGYASGNQAGPLNNGASSTHWHATLALPITDTPVQAFVKYMGYTNRVDSLGTVWTEHAVVGGVQVNLGCQCDKRLEPMAPLPFILRTVTTF